MSTPTSGGELAVRPPHTPTDETRRQVEMMAACGMSAEQIALVVHESVETINHFYHHELTVGGMKANTQVGAAVLSVAIDRDHEQFFQCASFWLRARAGWRDVRAVDQIKKIDLPEEQKTKLIDSILERLKPTKADFPVPAPAKKVG